MNRQEIKELAKSKISGNVWKLFWPVLVIGIAEGILTTIFTPKGMNTLDYTNSNMPQMSAGNALILLLIAIVFGVATVAYKRYVINFTRNGKCEFNDIINCMKEKWLNILIAEILTGILTSLASILFVIPGIILGFAYSMVTYLVIDTNLKSTDAMKESRRMMKGYKMDYFVFCLSFIGWIILAMCTFGILFIWLTPYMEVAEAIYYDKLKELKKVN